MDCYTTNLDIQLVTVEPRHHAVDDQHIVAARDAELAQQFVRRPETDETGKVQEHDPLAVVAHDLRRFRVEHALVIGIGERLMIRCEITRK